MSVSSFSHSVDECRPDVPCVMVLCVGCLCGARAAPMVATCTTSRSGWQPIGLVQLAVATFVNTLDGSLTINMRGCEGNNQKIKHVKDKEKYSKGFVTLRLP